MLVKTKDNIELHNPAFNQPDNIICIKLSDEEMVEKNNIFADWGGEDCYYCGGTARVLYNYFANKYEQTFFQPIKEKG